MSSDIESLKEAEKEALHSDQPRTVTHSGSNQNWIVGVVLIAAGTIFLLANTTGFYLQNWWALFILIPAISNLGQAWKSYQKNGRLNRGGRHAFTWGLILSMISATFLFNIDWDYVWPFFLIIGGLGMLLGNRRN